MPFEHIMRWTSYLYYEVDKLLVAGKCKWTAYRRQLMVDKALPSEYPVARIPAEDLTRFRHNNLELGNVDRALNVTRCLSWDHRLCAQTDIPQLVDDDGTIHALDVSVTEGHIWVTEQLFTDQPVTGYEPIQYI